MIRVVLARLGRPARRGLSSGACALGAVAALSAPFVACTHLQPPSNGVCEIHGSLAAAPRKLARLRHGMTKSAVDHILGAPTHSPIDGQYYYPTGGDCPMLGDDENGIRTASCGVVADFRVSQARDRSPTAVNGLLETCWWGAIGE